MNIPTPTELDRIQEGQDNSMFREVVDSIIQTLTRQYVTGSAVDTNIAASLVNERIIRRVINEFEGKNWIVHFGPIQGDQREGNFYSVRIQAKTGR